ncbi:PP2C family protein-serine/threonine phosphatase [Streptomyces sp. NPDC004647]|uniref:PP2C family protein-serine/threonine phosphatase n=1 Tax=Streptomyces sp. NPDC004647 TaxID=3154671 RepID=UPI0033B3656A
MAGVSMPAGAGERLLEELVAQTHQAAPMDLPDVASRYAKALGMQRATLYLVDIQQRLLVPLTGREESLGVDSSLAGWAYRTLSLRVAEEGSGELIVWLPLVDGAERLGVLEVRTPALDGLKLWRLRTLAALLAMAVTSKRASSDTLARQARTEAMQLPAEMLRAFLPPRTIGSDRAISTAVLEPAYELGGDAFDHSFTKDHLYASILDAMGHDLASGLATSVAMAGCRNARRTGADLLGLVAGVDEALAQWLPDQFCTGVFVQLDVESGMMRWCNCGHPTPLLIREHRLVDRALECSAEPPMGLPASLAGEPRSVHETILEPGDRVLLYTDGVVEARSEDGEQFGLERFTDHIIRATAAGARAPEVLRLLIHDILDHQDSDLSDDATILLLEWRPPGPLTGPDGRTPGGAEGWSGPGGPGTIQGAAEPRPS